MGNFPNQHRRRKTEVSLTLDLHTKRECERTESTPFIIVKLSVYTDRYKSAFFKVNFFLEVTSLQSYLTLHWCIGEMSSLGQCSLKPMQCLMIASSENRTMTNSSALANLCQGFDFHKYFILSYTFVSLYTWDQIY